MEESDSDSEDDSSSDKCLNVSIRRARISDVDNIFRIYSESIQYLDLESKEWIAGVIRKRSKRIRIYVAIHNKSVAGFAIVYKKRDKAYVDALAIDEMFRGRGIGECLLRNVEEALAGEGVEKIYLTVKNHNNRALGMYVKNGYRISNVILVLEAKLSNIDISVDKKVLDRTRISIDSVKRASIPRVKLLDLTMWNNFTWDVDEAIYRLSGEEVTIITVYNGRRIAGVAQLSTTSSKIVVERLALSYYRPTESLKVLIDSVKRFADRGIDTSIVIPVDSSKTSLLKTLISMGFRIVDSEYVLYKDVGEEQEKSISSVALAKHV
ncbi:MAG: GNAT family N-acetyltransferase [Ignisphaera sp.]